MMIICSSSSLCSTTPSLTMAATRSSSTPELEASRVWAKAAGPASARQQNEGGARNCFENHVSCFSPGPKFPGEYPRIACSRKASASSDTGESVQFQLHVEAGFLLALAIGDRASRHRAQTPATGLVFKPGKTLDQLAVAQAVDIPGVGIPVFADAARRPSISVCSSTSRCAR